MPRSSPSLTLGGKIVTAAGALFLISTFLPWYHISINMFGVSDSANANAWDVALGKLAALLVIVVLAEVILVQVANVKLPDVVPGFWNLGRLALSGLALLLVLVELIKGQGVPETPAIEGLPGGLGDVMESTFDISRSFGLFLAVLFLLTLVAGNVLRLGEKAPTAASSPAGTPGQSSQAPSGPPYKEYGEMRQREYEVPYEQNQQNQNQQNQNQQNQYGQPDGFGQNQPGQGQYGQPGQYGQGQPGQGQYGQPGQYGQSQPGQAPRPGQQYPPQ